jgi:hypothetical protein
MPAVGVYSGASTRRQEQFSRLCSTSVLTVRFAGYGAGPREPSEPVATSGWRRATCAAVCRRTGWRTDGRTAFPIAWGPYVALRCDIRPAVSTEGQDARGRLLGPAARSSGSAGRSATRPVETPLGLDHRAVWCVADTAVIEWPSTCGGTERRSCTSGTARWL